MSKRAATATRPNAGDPYAVGDPYIPMVAGSYENPWDSNDDLRDDYWYGRNIPDEMKLSKILGEKRYLTLGQKCCFGFSCCLCTAGFSWLPVWCGTLTCASSSWYDDRCSNYHRNLKVWRQQTLDAENKRREAAVKSAATPQSMGVVRSFITSNFRREYDKLKNEDLTTLGLQCSTLQLVTHYCGGQAEMKAQFERERNSSTVSFAFHLMFGAIQEGMDLVDSAQRLWSSPHPVSPKDSKEFCSILNHELRIDNDKCMPHAAYVVRCINKLCCVNFSERTKMPMEGKTFRGGGFCDVHQPFFIIGSVYRIPGFLATSFSMSVAERFAAKAQSPKILWVINVSPECRHANYVESSMVSGEEEYLFSPYSAFKVIEAKWSSDEAAPHRVTIQAFDDNLDPTIPADARLCPWY